VGCRRLPCRQVTLANFHMILPIGMGTETFPLRIKIKPVQIFKKPVVFKPLIPKLKFITNKNKWSGHLMGKAMRTIPKDDFELIGSMAGK